jgi:DNA/RNA-binding domain of Phe-tRNA-synthetase-like protein
MIDIDDLVIARRPGARVGALRLRNAGNEYANEAMDGARRELEEGIRSKYLGLSRKELAASPTVAAYVTYYKEFGKTYHVLLQLESIAFKGKSIPTVSPLVQAMFMAEMKNMLLTAAHDLSKIEGRVRLGLGGANERYVSLGGAEKTVAPGDLTLADETGVISSIIGGPDSRTAVVASTEDVLYTVYAPPGLDASLLESHLGDIARYVKSNRGDAVVEELAIYG